MITISAFIFFALVCAFTYEVLRTLWDGLQRLRRLWRRRWRYPKLQNGWKNYKPPRRI